MARFTHRTFAHLLCEGKAGVNSAGYGGNTTSPDLTNVAREVEAARCRMEVSNKLGTTDVDDLKLSGSLPLRWGESGTKVNPSTSITHR